MSENATGPEQTGAAPQRVAEKLRALRAGLPADEQAVLDDLLHQAIAHAADAGDTGGYLYSLSNLLYGWLPGEVRELVEPPTRIPTGGYNFGANQTGDSPHGPASPSRPA